jgi:uncharacterized coiled-coil protein SlyX
MKSTRTGWSLAAVAVLFPVLSVPTLGPSRQESEKSKLEERVEQLETQLRLQAEVLTDLSITMDEQRQLAAALEAGVVTLSQAADLSRKNGFEWAGANPQSRTDLLEGLKKFAKIVQAARPKPPAEEAKE